jgi:hypothetical protein
VLCEQYFGTFQIPTEKEKQHVFFQQRNTAAHLFQHSMEAVFEIFVKG